MYCGTCTRCGGQNPHIGQGRRKRRPPRPSWHGGLHYTDGPRLTYRFLCGVRLRDGIVTLRAQPRPGSFRITAAPRAIGDQKQEPPAFPSGRPPLVPADFAGPQRTVCAERVRRRTAPAQDRSEAARGIKTLPYLPVYRRRTQAPCQKHEFSAPYRCGPFQGIGRSLCGNIRNRARSPSRRGGQTIRTSRRQKCVLLPDIILRRLRFGLIA